MTNLASNYRLIYAEKEKGDDVFNDGFDKYLEHFEAGTLKQIMVYGGYYDRVERLLAPDGTIYQKERYPASEQDYVTQVYIVEANNE